MRNNTGSCFSQLSNEFAKLLGGSNRSLPKEILSSIIRGRSLLITMMNLLTILGDSQKSERDVEAPSMSQSEFLKEICAQMILI